MMPEISFKIKPPFDFALSLEFARCTKFEIENSDGSVALRKILDINGHPCFIKIDCTGGVNNPGAHVHWEALNGGSIRSDIIVGMVKRILSADVKVDQFYKVGEKSGRFRKIIEQYYGLKPILTPTVFESAAWAIMGQQVNLNFAHILKNRLVENYGREYKLDGYAYSLFPGPDKIGRADVASLTSMQFSERKAEYIIDLAREVSSGRLELDLLTQMKYDEALERLQAIRGIGVWSANYILMRGAGHLNCLPLGDSGLHRAIKKLYRLKELPDNTKVMQSAQKFAPFRSLYTLYLWCYLIKGEK
jgi:DNA-3-methyladenine glycosylase II